MLRSLAIFATTLLTSIQNLSIDSESLTAADLFDGSELSGLPATVDPLQKTELAQVDRFRDYQYLLDKSVKLISEGMNTAFFVKAMDPYVSRGFRGNFDEL